MQGASEQGRGKKLGRCGGVLAVALEPHRRLLGLVLRHRRAARALPRLRPLRGPARLPLPPVPALPSRVIVLPSAPAPASSVPLVDTFGRGGSVAVGGPANLLATVMR